MSCFITIIKLLYTNKDENVHRFALSAIRGELLERERDSFGILNTGYLLSLEKREREKEREREEEREREKERGKSKDKRCP